MLATAPALTLGSGVGTTLGSGGGTVVGGGSEGGMGVRYGRELMGRSLVEAASWRQFWKSSLRQEMAVSWLEMVIDGASWRACERKLKA